MYELMVADICRDRWFPVGRCDTFAGLVELMEIYKLALDYGDTFVIDFSWF